MRQKIVFMLLILGIIDSIYLTIVHFHPGALFCPSIAGVINCHNVLTSAFSDVLGIPLAILGLVWFLVMMFIFFYKPNKIIRNIWLILGVGGILYSITAQIIIKNICIYCGVLDVLIALTVIMFIFFIYEKKL